MPIPQPRHPTLKEMLEWERAQPERYEYVGGVLRAMVGGTLAHTRICMNLGAGLLAKLRGGPCSPFIGNAKVLAKTAFMYPDAVVTCSPVEMQTDTLPDPVVIFEVLSRTTQDYDQGSKWMAYQTIPSLQQFVLVSQQAWEVAFYDREDTTWRYGTVSGPEAVLELASLGVVLPLADIYDGSGVAS